MAKNKPPTSGPSGYEHWKAHIAGEPLRGIVEFTLYSDAHVTSEIREGFGPFTVLNTVAIARAQRRGESLPAMVLRCSLPGYAENSLPDMSQRDDATWHAGGLDDEIAALVGLALGIRIRSGGLTREFTAEDPLGVPREFMHKAPYLPSEGPRLVLPSAAGTHRIDQALELLSAYPSMTPDAAVTLVRAARAYQAGIWVAEEDPEYTWLKLVSSVEAVADHWWRQDADPAELLEAWDSDLTQRLAEAGGTGLVSVVAEKLVEVTRSTRKFLSFLEHYLPDPPPDRPTTYQVDWSTISKALRQVYLYRSQSLHGGKPFPGPLLSGPLLPTENEERPIGLSSAVGNAVWLAKDLPMHLHVFEYIVRGALHAWWKDASNSDSGE